MHILNHPKLSIYILLIFSIFISSILITLLIIPPSGESFNLLTRQVAFMPTSDIFIYILFNNLWVTFFLISIGILGIRFLPILIVGINGYKAGECILFVNNDIITITSILFPHGYIEYTIFFFCAACSLIIADEINKTNLNAIDLLKKHGNPQVKYILKNYLFKPYIYIIIPGIFVAAILETTFSFWNLRILVGV